MTISKMWARVRPFVTVKNATILLTIATSFGLVAPETATRLRNDVLAPIGLITAGTGDLL